MTELRDHPQASAKGRHIGLQGAEFGVRKIAPFQFRYPGLGDAHEGGDVSLSGIAVGLSDLGKLMRPDGVVHLSARRLNTLRVKAAPGHSIRPNVTPVARHWCYFPFAHSI